MLKSGDTLTFGAETLRPEILASDNFLGKAYGGGFGIFLERILISTICYFTGFFFTIYNGISIILSFFFGFLGLTNHGLS